MKRSTQLIILGVIAILIVVGLSVGITRAYIGSIYNSEHETQIDVKSCAKISFKGENVIRLTQTYPMSVNSALNNERPYTFTLNSTCSDAYRVELYLGVDGYLAGTDIHFALTEKGSKEIIVDGTLTENVTNVLTNEEKTQFQSSSNSYMSSIYKIYDIDFPVKGKKDYDIYIFIDENANIDANGYSYFYAAVGAKAFERELTFAEYIESQFQSNITNTNGLYHHNGTITSTSVGLNSNNTVLDANDDSYRYAGGDYKLTTLATSHEPAFTTIEDNLIIVTCGGSSSTIGTLCLTADQKYYLGYEEEGTRREFATYKLALDAAVTDGYLTADNIKNYVCFGYDGEYTGTCAEDNLYRIIGVFGSNVKLIKADLADTNLLGEDFDYKDSETASNKYTAYTGTLTNLPYYYWSRYNSGYTGTPNYDTVGSAYKDTNVYNVWSYGYLNQKNLNTNYLNNIGTKWASMITKTTWNNNNSVLTNAKAAYNADYASTTSPYNQVEAKIGLMYVNEYAYGADPSNWATNLGSGYNNAKVTSENWLYNGVVEWTISRTSDAYYAYRASNSGFVNADHVSFGAHGMRPVFNLSSSVTYDGGTGSASDPYRIV